MDATQRHLNDVINSSTVNRERYQRNMIARQALVKEPEEPGRFPITWLPRRETTKFYGREAELLNIDKALNWRTPGNPPLRTYTIYGKRGVGKTELALKYATSNPAQFDAIFWVRCETALGLRQSFTEMAIQLNLPRADHHGIFPERQFSLISCSS